MVEFLVRFSFDILAFMAVMVLIVLGLGVIASMMGIFNFAHGELFMLGAYAMFYCVAVLKLPFAVGVVVAAVLLFLVGILIERGLIEPLRRRAGRDWLIDS
ncbi:MAG: ABC transporter permease subunit, partial [Gammaproteobacteria bacterium]